MMTWANRDYCFGSRQNGSFCPTCEVRVQCADSSTQCSYERLKRWREIERLRHAVLTWKQAQDQDVVFALHHHSSVDPDQELIDQVRDKVAEKWGAAHG
jgi:hypothetical protein